MDVINIKNNGFPPRYPYQLTDRQTIMLVGAGTVPEHIDINLIGENKDSSVYIKVNKECGKDSANVNFFTYKVKISAGEIVAFMYDGKNWNRFL